MRTVRPDLHPLAHAVRHHLRELPGVANAHGAILVALSGGMDSVTLLHLLRFGGVLPAVPLVAAHFDHRMRPDSRADAEWVRGLTWAWQVPLQFAAAAVPPRGEAAARKARYAFLADVAERVGARAVLTAHHLDDQAETVLFRLLRGAGLVGVRGIAEVRGWLVRPLLPFRRAEVLAYARDAGLRWRDDPTNRDLRFARNRLRVQVLGPLEAARPGTAEALARLASAATAAEARLRPLTQEALELARLPHPDGIALARDIVLTYDLATRARVMRVAFDRLGRPLGRGATRAILTFLEDAPSGARLHAPGGFTVEREFDRFVIRRPTEPAEDQPLRIPSSDEGRGVARVGGAAFRFAWGHLPQEGGTTVGFDAAALEFPLLVRGWRPGDRIRLGYGSKKLKKLFGELRLARAARFRVPVLADATGQPLWIVGVARSARAEPRPGHTTLFITVWE